MKAFIIHGAYGNPSENWFPWLKKNLEKEGFTVIVPQFPTPENQSLNNWNKVFEKYIKSIYPSDILIGHSIGVAFILNVLNNLNVKVNTCYLVAGFVRQLGDQEFDKINKTFLDRTLDWINIKKNCNKFRIYHSYNDPYVNIDFGIELAKNLNAELEIIKGAGHFNSKSGYHKFDRLFKEILEDRNN